MKRSGLPKQCLLRKSGEFMQVYRQGRRLKGQGFSLIYRANGLETNRLGVSIHRLVRGSVRRNRIKRMIREVFRLHREMFPGAADIVITVTPDFSCPTSSAVRSAFSDLLSRRKTV